MPREETLHRCVGGRYTLLEPLGRGGMGTVWRGHDELLRRDVAVKQVAVHAGAPGSPSASARERVMREAQAAARLSHPASVTVYDVLEEDGSIYIVMELLVADTLAGVVERAGPLAPADAARLGAELAGVLDAAHRQGIVHRDVKPGNVMVLPSGGVKLTDFGIASVKDDPALTATGQVLGSPSYMAPEQALGERAGPAADSWGLGATLYFAVEGRPPFERPGALSTLTAVVNDDPAPPQLAGPLAPVLQGLLAKDPGARPTPADARRALRALAEQVSRPSAAPVAEPPLAPPDDPTATAVMDVPPPPVRAAPAPRHPPPQAVPPPAPPLPPPP
ncbi:MAG: serine/threonine protein kinase, partial [Actinomycetota bacterium]|nr:serine/threonine protein kinase [Actinomycetota bacterium]